MSRDAEFTAWRRQWQTTPPCADTPAWAAAISERVARQSRLMRVGLIGPILVTIVIGGLMLLRAVSSGTRLDLALAVESWLFIALVWAGSLWLARGTWRPIGQTTAAFVTVSIWRCESDIASIRLGVALYVGQLALTTLLIAMFRDPPLDARALLFSWPMIVIGWIGLPVFVAWSFGYLRRRRAERARLLDLQRQLASDGP